MRSILFYWTYPRILPYIVGVVAGADRTEGNEMTTMTRTCYTDSYGDLMDYETARTIRPATAEEIAASDEAAVCPTCEGKRLHRLVSKVRMLRSEESRMESLAELL